MQAGTARSDAGGTVARLFAARLLTTGARLERAEDVVSTGLPPLDRFLPSHGYPLGSISELIGHDFKHVLAAFALAAASRKGRVAGLSPAGFLNPMALTAAGADLERCFFLVHADRRKLLQAAEEIVSSGLFSLVSLHAGRWEDGSPLLQPVAERRLLGLVVKHKTALLLLLEDHPELAHAARPCALRLEIIHASPPNSTNSTNSTPSVSEGPRVASTAFTGLIIRLRKCAGHAPGQVLHVPAGSLADVPSPAGAVRSCPSFEPRSGAAGRPVCCPGASIAQAGQAWVPPADVPSPDRRP